MHHFFRHNLILHLRELENSSDTSSRYANNSTNSWENRSYCINMKYLGEKGLFFIIICLKNVSNKRVCTSFSFCLHINRVIFVPKMNNSSLLRCNEIWLSLEYWIKSYWNWIFCNLFYYKKSVLKYFFLFAKVFDRSIWYVLFLLISFYKVAYIYLWHKNMIYTTVT